MGKAFSLQRRPEKAEGIGNNNQFESRNEAQNLGEFLPHFGFKKEKNYRGITKSYA